MTGPGWLRSRLTVTPRRPMSDDGGGVDISQFVSYVEAFGLVIGIIFSAITWLWEARLARRQAREDEKSAANDEKARFGKCFITQTLRPVQ